MALGFILSGYPRPRLPLLPLLLLPLLPLLLLPLEPDDRDGGDTDEPRELLPDDRGATLLGREELLGRAGRALLLGREELGRAGRALLPDGRLVDDGRTLLAGRLELPDGLTASLDGRRDVPLRIPSVLREPRVVAPGRTAPRVLVLTPGLALPRVATVRVEMRPLASREIAVRVAVREVRVPILSREEERAAMWRLLTIMVPG